MTTTSDATAPDLCDYIAASPTPHHAVDTSMRRLGKVGFTALSERERWPAGPGNFMVARQGSLVAWRQPDAIDPNAGIRMVGAHTDSPNLRLKPHPDVAANPLSGNWRQIAVETYGGVLWNSWLDRDLGIAGLLVVRGDGGTLDEILVGVDEPWLRIPQLAIHLDRDVNTAGLRLDPQRHLTPVWATGSGVGIVAAVAATAGVDPDRVVSSQLMLHDLTPPTVAGHDASFIASPRIDNLLSCWAAVAGLSSATSAATSSASLPMVCLYDHEEVGSQSATGAASSLVNDVITRIAAANGLDPQDMARLRASSLAVSADGAHATHPNLAERHDPGHGIAVNGGIVVKHNANQRYATEAAGTAWLRTIARHAGVPLQDFVMRNDMPCGSTIGPISAAGLGITTVDIGVAQLAMHSARETCGSHDAERLVTLLTKVLSD
jgi:aspartyl aminopeptidase